MEGRPGSPTRLGRAQRLAAAIAFTAAVLLLPFALFHFALPFVGARTLGNDYPLFSTPQQMELQYSLAHGTWPLYAPGFAGGRPAAALTLGQQWHPIAHLAAHLPGYWDGHALDWNTLLRLLSLGLAHLALIGALGRLGLRREAAFAVAFVAVYNMRMLDAFRFGAALESYTGMLFMCAAIMHLHRARERLWPAAAAIGATFLTAVGGHPQMMYFGLLGAGLFGLAAPFALPAIAGAPAGGRARVAGFYGKLALCLAAGLALAAAYLFPLYADFVSESAVRAGRGYGWSLLNQDSLGGALNSLFAPLDVSVTGAFGGSSLLVLALFAPLLAKGSGRAGIAVVAVFAAAALVFLVGLGGATPLHRAAWEWLPLYGAFRVPGRVTFILPGLLLLLLAWALGRRGDGAVVARGRALPLTRSGALALAALAAFAVYLLWLRGLLPAPTRPLPATFGKIPAQVPALLAALGAATLAAAALRGLLRGGWSRALGVVVALLVVAETGVVLRYGTWIGRRRETPTLAAMDRDKRASLRFRPNAGYGMHSDLAAKKIERSFLDPDLAEFYPAYLAVADERAAFAAMARRRASDTAVVEGIPGGDRRAASGAAPDAVTLTRSTFNEVVFAVANHQPGILCYAALDRKGRWRAEVDGAAARIYAANGGEQAVRLDPGAHTVAFRFESPATRAGVAVSLATLALVGIILAWRGLRRLPRAGRAAVAAGIAAAAVAAFALFDCGARGGDDLGSAYRWRSDQRPPVDDVAFGRRARMSSLRRPQTPYEWYAGRGVDGDRRAPGFATAGGEERPWWAVDLGAAIPIGRIDVYRGRPARGDRPAPFEVELSTDGKRFAPLDPAAVRGGAEPWRFAPGGAVARYVRLRGRGKGALELAEVEVYSAQAGEGDH